MNEETLLKNCTYNFQKFYKYTKRYCKKHGKNIILVDSGSLKREDGDCAGFCDGYEMVIAAKNPIFEQNYCHEFAHMQQAVEGCPLWDDSAVWKPLKKRLTLIKNWQQLYTIIQLERDCEQRALKLSKKYDLFNNVDYAKRANLYLYYHHYIFIKQKYLNADQLFNSEMLYKKMPSTLLKPKDLHNIDMKMMVLFEDIMKGIQ